MKTFFSTLFICLSLLTYCQDSFSEDEIPDKMFGSMDSLINNAGERLLIPEECHTPGIVYIQFLLKADGGKENFTVIKRLCRHADSVAIAIIKELEFSPRKVNNIAVDSKKIMSIPFKKRD